MQRDREREREREGEIERKRWRGLILLFHSEDFATMFASIVFLCVNKTDYFYRVSLPVF